MEVGIHVAAAAAADAIVSEIQAAADGRRRPP